ncbi:DUF4231 domain-containing protein [Nonomuraea basaltis]|uniref:DUF4231 domain-containing protein n=1 Tax=Nonomuraea basaltis TaxID=2495887 RepID=UPI00110C6D5B|nr:DUF4231 domain-containing protein [Nonomuraea basaltis]TMR97567.1 DUF4231 domain-containing protein [Nonomuraea basaltis]
MDYVETPEINETRKKTAAIQHDLRKWRLSYMSLITVVSSAILGSLTFLTIGLIVRNQSLVNNTGNFLAILVIFSPAWGAAALELRDRLFGLRQELVDLRHALRSLVAKAVNSPQSRYISYKDSLPELILHFRTRANRYRYIHNALQTIVIAGSVITSTIIAAAGDLPWGRWLGATVALLLGVSAGVSSYFKLNDKSAALQKAADDIEIEMRAFDLSINDYGSMETGDAIIQFVKKVEKIRVEHATHARDLDQSADRLTFTYTQSSSPT